MPTGERKKGRKEDTPTFDALTQMKFVHFGRWWYPGIQPGQRIAGSRQKTSQSEDGDAEKSDVDCSVGNTEN